MEEYEEEFDKLSHFAPEMVAMEKTRVQRFVQGLKVGLRGLVYSQDPKTYDAALRAAVRIDADAREGEEYRRSLMVGISVGQKRKADQKAPEPPQTGSHSDRPFNHYKQLATEAGGVWRDRPVCKNCGKRHWGRCLIGTGACFRCKQEGHTAEQCPGTQSSKGKGQPTHPHLRGPNRQQH